MAKRSEKKCMICQGGADLHMCSACKRAHRAMVRRAAPLPSEMELMRWAARRAREALRRRWDELVADQDANEDDDEARRQELVTELLLSLVPTLSQPIKVVEKILKELCPGVDFSGVLEELPKQLPQELKDGVAAATKEAFFSPRTKVVNPLNIRDPEDVKLLVEESMRKGTQGFVGATPTLTTSFVSKHGTSPEEPID